MSDSVKTLLVIGSGLAGAMTALSLSKSLGPERRLIYLRMSAAPESDCLYGSVTAPTAYDFLLKLGLDEPTLFTRTSTSFSLGTKYSNWGGVLPWIQCHQQPLPLVHGVPMRHHLTRQNRPLSSILVGAQTAEQGRFAHPPEDPNVPLSRAEYGYQFSVAEWAALLEQFLRKSEIEITDATHYDVQFDGDAIQAITPEAGAAISADLYIDCSGIDRVTCPETLRAFEEQKKVCFSSAASSKEPLGPAYRRVAANDLGWSAITALQGREEALTISGETGDAPSASVGRSTEAWRENCVSIGHAAGLIEPLTPAPMTLLQRDIERLLELIPVTDDMTAERREYNRRFANDFDHAKMFQDTLFHANGLPASDYWQSSTEQAQDPRLIRKLQQYENRGVLVRYDLEPFNDEDWTILHAGLGRTPRQYDLQTDSIPMSESVAQSDALQRSIAAMVPKVPPHHLYVANMKRYFEKQNYA
jgi:tryptophan halogenase